MTKLAMLILMFAGVAAAAPADDDLAAHRRHPGGAGAPTGPEMPMPPPAPTPPIAELRKTCVDAMNADPTFAKSILETVDKQIEQHTLQAHQDADYHIQKNERHVIYAYAAMWIVAALFVVYLWRRQASLQAEIAQLRRELDAAAKDAK